MGKYYQVTFLLFFTALFYAQDKIEKGTYFSTTPQQNIKLKLKEDNTYELVVLDGNFNVKNDTIFLNNDHEDANDFNITFNAKADPSWGKVKVKISGYLLYYSGIYLGSQSGNTAPEFKSIIELAGSDESLEKEAFQFEINRGDYFYIAREEESGGESALLKYELPKNANEIKIEYIPNYMGKAQLKGYLNDKNEMVVISEKNKSMPLIFVPENERQKALEPNIKPLETKVQKNWTYPGKENSYHYGIVDSLAVAPSFKFSIQDNLKKAQEITNKGSEKFLVVVYDPDNKDAKTKFNEFIRNQEYAIAPYISYDGGNSYDKYNYYLANSKDKTWAFKNKIKDNPSVIVIDGEGNVLSQTRGTIVDNASLFEPYYTTIDEKLKKTKALIDLNKAINSKAPASEILKALASLPENEYDAVIEEPVMESTKEEAMPASEVEAVGAVDYPGYSPNETVFSKPAFDKKKVLLVWENIIKSHSTDTKPDMEFVKVALADIQNKGFYMTLFKEERLFNETNFQAINYLTKHYDAILAQQTPREEQDSIYRENIYSSETINTILPNAVSANVAMMTEQTPVEYQKRMLAVYKKIMEKVTDDDKRKSDYFSTLNAFSRKMNVEEDYVAEYDHFFNRIFKGMANEIEALDAIYSYRLSKNQEYDDWSSFKNYFSSSSNQAAWFVVERAKNPESIKKAIKWSESSLRIEKNNPYYLDTLAQLYYKNGEKHKAIATQEKAVEFSSEMGDETKSELKEVLVKMKNGTY